MLIAERASVRAGLLPALCWLAVLTSVACGSSEGDTGSNQGGTAGSVAGAGGASGGDRAGASGSGAEGGLAGKGSASGGTASGGTASGGTASGGSEAGDAGESGAGGASASGGTSGETAGGTAGTGGTAGGSSSLARAIAATQSGTCALDAAGAIHCWGFAPQVWDVPSGAFVELYAGADTVCAVRADRSVACFGEPNGVVDTSHAPSAGVTTLGVGSGIICATEIGGDLFCESLTAALEVPPPAAELPIALSVGNQFACGIREEDGTLFCWGSETLGSCDFSPPADQLEAPAGSFVVLASGPYSSCAVDVDGELACWGLGKPDDPPSGDCATAKSYGQSDPPDGTFRTVAVGKYNACGIRSDGTLACWGAGTSDDCESGTSSCRQSRPPGGTFEQVVAGTVHACAMSAERKVECWGYESGVDDIDERTFPPPVFQ
jgi:hypothetical protein